jgi:hypothetical protein
MNPDDSSGDRAPCPKEGAVPTWLGFSIGVDFYPALKISRKTGLEFTRELAEHIEPENVHLQEDGWKISGGGIYEGIDLSVTKNQILSQVKKPAYKLEWYEHRISAILRAFETIFAPQIALQTSVVMSGLVDLFPDDTDARFFLGGNVMLMDPKRFTAIGRPTLDILGLRMFFPETEKENWSVNVRVESFAFDPKKVFLQAEAAWQDHAEWGTNFADTAVARITTVSRFMQGPLIDFLMNPPPSGVDDEEDDK